MLSIRLSNMIGGICDSLNEHNNHSTFDYNEKTSTYSARALLFTFDVHMAYFQDEEKYESDRLEVSVLVAGHRVWVKTGRLRSIPLSWDDWENTSNHDSCWRSDGLDSPLSKVYFTLSEQINVKREMAEKERVAPKDMTEYTWSPIGTRMFRNMRVSWQRTEDNYHLRLTNLEEL